jgi:hypothetical protein
MAPPNKAIALVGLACRGQPAGSPLLAKIRDAERRCPHRRGMPGPRWSTRHRSRAVRNGLQRCIVAQVAAAILGKQAPGQNPDKDEVQVLPALGSTCGRRGPYPTVLGRPAPDAQAYFSLGPVSRLLHRALWQRAAAVRASRTNRFALVQLRVSRSRTFALDPRTTTSPGRWPGRLGFGRQPGGGVLPLDPLHLSQRAGCVPFPSRPELLQQGKKWRRFTSSEQVNRTSVWQGKADREPADHRGSRESLAAVGSPSRSSRRPEPGVTHD